MGLTLFPSGRLVFHHQNSEAAASKLVQALRELMEDYKVSGGYT